METADEIRKRADAYRLLAACFYCPDEVWKEENLLGQVETAWRHFGDSCADAAKKLTVAGQEGTLQDLAIAYAKLFVGPFALQAPPYGSCYLEPGGRVMGLSTMEVRKIYRAHGLALDSEFHDLPDHIAVELEFMHFLVCREDAGDASVAKQAQRHFMDGFLWPFAKAFCVRLKEAEASGPFYRSLAECLESYLVMERCRWQGKS
jgi:TorA maturation chaperone TorD